MPDFYFQVRTSGIPNGMYRKIQKILYGSIVWVGFKHVLSIFAGDKPYLGIHGGHILGKNRDFGNFCPFSTTRGTLNKGYSPANFENRYLKQTPKQCFHYKFDVWKCKYRPKMTKFKIPGFSYTPPKENGPFGIPHF